MNDDPPEHPGGTPVELDSAWEEGEDPVLVKLVRKTLAPYLGRVSSERLAHYRNLVILFITTHPAMAARYERVRTRPVVDAGSTKLAKDQTPKQGQQALPLKGKIGE